MRSGVTWSLDSKAFQKDLRKRQLTASDCREAVMDGLLVGLRGIQRRCPVDTGTLRASYLPRIISASETGASGDVGTNVDYADDQEFGTVFQAGTPHVRPTWDEDQDLIIRAVQSSIRRKLAA